ncbi:MAG: hypothetical protein ACKOWF_07430, partial [Chloroflexota bacterium]
LTTEVAAAGAWADSPGEAARPGRRPLGPACPDCSASRPGPATCPVPNRSLAAAGAGLVAEVGAKCGHPWQGGPNLPGAGTG